VFPLDENGLTILDAYANITHRGRRLNRSEKKAVLRFGERDFLEAFYNLTPGKKAAVRLRYGENTYKWYREEWRGNDEQGSR